MNFISMCSGIEAASVAFNPLRWEAVAYSEIEPFPCAVLEHHYPDVPNHGDITKFDWSVYRGKVDMVCAGFPCQAFSIAGLRDSLEDGRGNLSLIGIKAIKSIRPKWVLLEQVPGVFSADGNPFGCILAGLSGADAPLMPGTRNGKWTKSGVVSAANKEGYGLAWRVLDAQYFGVPQRRRRIFVVGHIGDWRPPVAVLFEPKGVCRDFAEGQEKGTAVAALTATSVGTCGADNNQAQAGHIIVMAHGQGNAEIIIGKSPVLSCNHEAPIIYENHGQDNRIKEVNVSPQINAKAGTGGGNLPLVQAWKQRPEGDVIQSEVAYNISTTQNASAGNTGKIMVNNSIRRLTPIETERLQGFPDFYTKISVKVLKRKPRTKHFAKYPDLYQGNPDGTWTKFYGDGPRYKAIGNSWAVPCAAWIGRRIQQFEDSTKLIKEEL